MERSLINICEGIEPDLLGRICHSHLKEARHVLQEAVQYYDGPARAAATQHIII